MAPPNSRKKSMTRQPEQALSEYGGDEQHEPAPLWLRVLVPVAVIGGAILLAGGIGMLREEPPEKPAPDTRRLVETISVQPADITYTVESQGTVEPRTQTTLVPQVAGKIVEVSDNFVAGSFVEAGETLLRIDPSDFETALASAEADLANARAQLAEEAARAEQARRDWENLHGDTDREPNPLVLREPQVAQARARVRAAEAAVERAKRDLERTRISVPYPGIVRSRDADLGQYVSQGNQLGEVFAVEVAEVRLPLSDSDQAYLDLPEVSSRPMAKAIPVEFTATVGQKQRQWSGRIVRTEGTVDQESRVVYAVARVQDPYGVLGTDREVPLKMGTFVRADIRGHSVDNAVALPRSTLRPDDTVLVANEQDELEIREVTVSRRTEDHAYISGGLADGDRVITTAISAPIPGMALRVEGGEGPDPARLAETEEFELDEAEASAGDKTGEDSDSGGASRQRLNARAD